MELIGLFIGFHPDEIFGPLYPGAKALVSVDMAELIIVFGTLAVSMVIMVKFGDWWSR
jgi:hypothetical protein